MLGHQLYPETACALSGLMACPQPRQTGRTDTDLRKTYMCSICLSRSGQAPVARSSSRLHKQIPSFTMSISRIHRPIRRRTRRSQERPRHKGARATSGGKWWSQTGSNRRPEACKATALPTELWPRLEPNPASQASPDSAGSPASIMVGLGRFELPTSRLSSARSNQLSYRPGAP